MSLLSTVSSAVSSVTGLSVRTKLEIGLVAALALAVFMGCQWVDGIRDDNMNQAKQIITLTANKATLEQEKVQLQTDKAAAEALRDVYAGRAESLNQENQKNEQKAQQYQKDSENMRKKLADLQRDDACATHPVPDSVISVQQQAITDFNAGYTR